MAVGDALERNENVLREAPSLGREHRGLVLRLLAVILLPLGLFGTLDETLVLKLRHRSGGQAPG